MKETEIYAKLRILFVRNKCLVQRIESGTTGLGIPDIFFRTNDSEGWIELKEIFWPSKETTSIKIPFRPGQYPWLKQYTSLNGKAFLICSLYGKTNIFIFLGRSIFKEYTQKEFLRKAYYIGKISKLTITDFY